MFPSVTTLPHPFPNSTVPFPSPLTLFVSSWAFVGVLPRRQELCFVLSDFLLEHLDCWWTRPYHVRATRRKHITICLKHACSILARSPTAHPSISASTVVCANPLSQILRTACHDTYQLGQCHLETFLTSIPRSVPRAVAAEAGGACKSLFWPLGSAAVAAECAWAPIGKTCLVLLSFPSW